MNEAELFIAFEKALRDLNLAGWVTLRPDDVFDENNDAPTQPVRRGIITAQDSETIAFGDGAYTRSYGTYQIDLWVPRDMRNALQELGNNATLHINSFFPTNGRGRSLIRGTTQADIKRRPVARYLGRAGAYLREAIDVEFEVDV